MLTALLAYVGPGAGMGAIGAIIALVGSILISIGVVVAYPIRKMMKSRKAASAEGEAEEKSAPDTETK